MINKSIQPVDLTNILSSTPQTAVSGSTEGGDGALFSQLLSGQANTQGGKPLPASGNNLPTQAAPAESETHTTDTVSPIIEHGIDQQLPASTLAHAGQTIVLASGSPVQIQTPIQTTGQGQEISAAIQPATVANPVITVQVENPAASIMQQATLQALPAIEEAVRTAMPLNTAPAVQVQPDVQLAPVADRVAEPPLQLPPLQLPSQVNSQADRVAETPLQLPPQVNSQTEQVVAQSANPSPQSPTQLPAQVFNASALAAASQQVEVNNTNIQAPAQSTEQTPQTGNQPTILPAYSPAQQAVNPAFSQQAQPVDPAAARILSQAATIEATPVATELSRTHFVNDAGQVRAAVNVLPATESGRAVSGQEPINSIMRDAARMAVASQADFGDLKQSMQGQQGMLQGSDMTAVLNRSDASNPVAFMQTLSENSPLTLPSARVQVPVGQLGWSNAVGQQVNWFISQNVSAANLRLSPQNLGPVEMHISMDGDKANITFLSQNGVVREALESSLPRLREMLAESGLELVNVNISQHGASQQNARNGAELQHGEDLSRMDANSDASELEANGLLQQARAETLGLIDAYA